MKMKEMYDLSGKVALVTGGSVGLGEQMAVALAEAGASVVIAARKLDRSEATAGKIRLQGGRALALKCDVSRATEVDAMVEETLREFGRIDILVNSAGITWGAPSEDHPVDKFEKVLAVNVTGTFLCCQRAGRIMIERQGGKIINLASICAVVGEDPDIMQALAYHASKGAVISLTRALAAEWARYNISVNAIAPGWFPTNMTQYMVDEKRDGLLHHIPMRRFGSEADIKGAVLYLSSEASNYVTGHTLCVDGGYLAV
jgi:gluconate 5-dehydrogenase